MTIKNISCSFIDQFPLPAFVSFFTLFLISSSIMLYTAQSFLWDLVKCGSENSGGVKENVEFADQKDV